MSLTVGPPAAPSPADPGGEHAKIVQEVVEDPIGQAGMEAHEALHVADSGRNLAIIWFDVTHFPLHVYKKITRQVDNLGPTVLFASTEAVEARTREVLDSAKGLEGHVFNLGHGVMPNTPPDALTRLVEYVHTNTAR